MTFLYPKPVRQPKVRKPLLRKTPLLRSKTPIARRSPLRRSTKPIARRTRLKWRKKRDKRMEDWHKAVCDRAKVADNVYICFHCGGHFQQDEVCGDHFPFPRSVRPDLKYNVENGVPSCWACNQKDSKKRAASLDYWKKTGNVVPVWDR